MHLDEAKNIHFNRRDRRDMDPYKNKLYVPEMASILYHHAVELEEVANDTGDLELARRVGHIADKLYAEFDVEDAEAADEVDDSTSSGIKTLQHHDVLAGAAFRQVDQHESPRQRLQRTAVDGWKASGRRQRW